MKNRILLLLLLLTPGATICMAQDAQALIKKVKAKLEQVNDYEGYGLLKTDVVFMKVPDSKVTVYYKKPDKFKIKKQDGISIVPKGGISVNLNSLFIGDQFTAVDAGKTIIDGMPVSIVKLLPLDEKSEVVISTLYVDDKQALIRKATTTTKDNGTYDMEMSYGKYAAWGLPDTVVFTFNTSNYKLPKGLAFDYDTGEKPQAGTTAKNQKGKLVINYSSYSINKGIAESVFVVK